MHGKFPIALSLRKGRRTAAGHPPAYPLRVLSKPVLSLSNGGYPIV